MTDPVESAIVTEHDRQERLWSQRARVEAILAEIEYRDWRFCVRYENTNRVYLQIEADGIDAESGELHTWRGRKWMLSPHMTKSEIVQTAFLAVMVAEEHETRERFRFRGVSIFNPHYDVDRLALHRRSAGVLDVRDGQ